jgi:hypothetical protein
MKYSGVDVLIAGLLSSLAIIFPIVFHAVGLGSAFLPMFYPVVVAGFLINVESALLVGILSPLLSAILTGMPPFFPPIAFIMMAEGIVLVVTPWLLYQKFQMNIRFSLVFTLLLDRLVLLMVVVAISGWLDLPRDILGIISVVRGFPGLLVMLIVIPPLVKRLEIRKKQIMVLE